jgi:hypothetical protein
MATYDGPGNNHDKANAIGLNGDGNVFITGGSYIDNYDFATVKYNSAGVQKWVKQHHRVGSCQRGGKPTL